MDGWPAEARQELVMSVAAFEGHTVTTYRFRSTERPDVLAESMRTRWVARGVAFVEARRGDWTILSARDTDGIRTVQMRPTASGTEGLSSTWGRAEGSSDARGGDDSAADALADWLPADSRVLRRLSHRDAGREGATLVAVAATSPAQAASRLRQAAVARRFDDDPSAGLPAGRAAWYRGGGASGEALAFRRGAEELVATVSVHPEGTAIVLHWGRAR